MLRRFYNKLDYRIWLSFIVRKPWLTICLIAAITAFFGVRLPDLKIHATSYEVIIKDLQVTKDYERFLKEFGGGEYIQVIARADNVFDPETFEQLTLLHDKFTAVPGVKKVISLPGIKRDMDLLDEWSVAEFEEKVQPVTLFRKNVFSDNGKNAAFTLLLDDIREEEAIVGAVDWIIRDSGGGLNLYQIGMPLVSQTLLASIKRDFSWLPPITFAVMVLTLIALFRSVRLVIAPVACIVACLTWTFGTMAWTNTPVSSMTLVVPIFLMAVGTAYCLHVLAEYLHVCKNAKSKAQAAELCLRHVRLPTTLAVSTTLIGLGSLVFNPTDSIREFAIPACIGMLSFLLLIFTLFPAVLALIPIPKPRDEAREGWGLLSRFLFIVARTDVNRQKGLFIIIGIIIATGLIGLTRLTIDADTTRYFRESEPVTKNFHQVYEDMAGSFPVNVVLESEKPGYFQDPAHLKKVLEFQKYLESLDGIDKTMSFADYVKLINYSINDYLPEYYALPRDPAEMPNFLNLYQMLMGPEMSRRFVNADFSRTALLMMMHISSGHKWLDTQEAIEKYAREHFGEDFEVRLSSMGIIVAHSNQVVTEGLVKSLFIVLVLVFVIMVGLFLSVKAGAITLLPNAFPILIVFGAMGWLSIELSMNTAMIATIAIGLALDDTIHYMVRYNREFRRHLDRERALYDSILSVGRPMVFTSVTICLGFFILTFSAFKPTAIFGGLMMATMVSALAGDLLILPSLMLHAELVTVFDLLRVRLGKDLDQRIPLFRGLSRNQIRTILVTGAIQEVAQGEDVVPEREGQGPLSVIISGEIAMFHASAFPGAGEEAGEVRVGTLRTGDVIGGIGTAFWHGDSVRLTATAPVELLVIQPKVVERLRWLYPPTAYKFYRNLMENLTERLLRATDHITRQGFRPEISGLVEPRTFTRAVEIEMIRSNRYGGELGVCIIEIRNLPVISRDRGLALADEILCRMAEIVSEELRGFDLFCRLSANRFGLLLIQMNRKDLIPLEGRLNKLFAEMSENPRIPGLDIHLGFAHFQPGQEISAEGVITNASQDAKKKRHS